MALSRRSLFPVLTATFLLVAACRESTSPGGPLTVQTSLSRSTIVPGDTMSIHIAVTSLMPTASPGPGTCNFPFFVVKNSFGDIVDQGGTICASSDQARFPVASANYVWSAEPYDCSAGPCHQVPLPAGFYSITGEYQTAAGPIYSDAKFIQVMN